MTTLNPALLKNLIPQPDKKLEKLKLVGQHLDRLHNTLASSNATLMPVGYCTLLLGDLETTTKRFHTLLDLYAVEDGMKYAGYGDEAKHS